jgi:hypothetical protein
VSLHSDNGPSQSNSWLQQLLGKDPDVPSEPPYKKFREFGDWLKWLLTTIVGVAALGWLGHSYIDNFQTKAQADEAQQSNEQAHGRLQRALDAQDREQRYFTVRINLQQQNTHDQLDQLVELQTAATRAERREAQAHAKKLRRRIERRQRVIQDPRALKRLADRLEQDPLGDLEP